jgi:hypothetical protein
MSYIRHNFILYTAEALHDDCDINQTVAKRHLLGADRVATRPQTEGNRKICVKGFYIYCNFDLKNAS